MLTSLPDIFLNHDKRNYRYFTQILSGGAPFIIPSIFNNKEDGLFLSFSNRNTITHNTVYDNEHSGIHLWYSGNSTVLNNIIYIMKTVGFQFPQ